MAKYSTIYFLIFNAECDFRAGRCPLGFDKESLTNSSVPNATRCKISSNIPSIWRHLCSLIYNAWASWLFCVICYFRNYSWSCTSKLRTCGLISWFRNLNLKWIDVLGKFRSRFHPSTVITPFYLPSNTLPPGTTGAFCMTFPLWAAENKENFLQNDAETWSLLCIILPTPCLLNILPGYYSDIVLFGWVRQRWGVHLSAQTVPSAGRVWADDLICSWA